MGYILIVTRASQLEQDFEIASNEYEYINTAMKQDMPRFMVLATRFIDPLFHSFFYMQYALLRVIPLDALLNRGFVDLTSTTCSSRS